MPRDRTEDADADAHPEQQMLLLGDLAVTPALAQESKGTRSRQATNAVKAAAEIATSRPTGDDIAFMHAVLCQIGLPRSKVIGERFERRSGGAALVIRAGEIWNGQDLVMQPLPYGPTPRVALSYITTYAVRHRTREVPFGDSVNDALRLLGITKGGRSYAMFRQQISSLAACSLTMGFNAGNRAYTFSGQPIEQFEAWLTDRKGPPVLWPSRLVLSSSFYETLLENPVPHDLRALWALRSSSLAMDIYLWMASRLWRLPKGPGVTLRWRNLREQFAQEYQGKDADKDFKKKFLEGLHKVKSMYPDARVSPLPGGLRLQHSPPAVDPIKQIYG